MSSDAAKKILELATKYADLTSDLLLKEGKKKPKQKGKVKARNRGDVVVPAERTKDKKKDHYPVNNIDQARNALSRSHGYDKSPPWYNGSLESLQEAIRRKVHSKYPSIEISDKKSKKSSLDSLLNKYAEETDLLLANIDPIEENPEALLPQQAKAPFVPTPSGQAQAPRVKRPANVPQTYAPPPDYKPEPNAPPDVETYAPPPDYKPEVEDIDDWEDEIDEPKPATKASLRISERLLEKYGQNPTNLSNIEQSVFPQPTTNYQDVGPTPNTPNPYAKTNDPHKGLAYHPTKPVSNPNVVKVQTALKQMGLKGGDGKDLLINGIIGPNTRFALQSFKQHYGMDNTTDAIAMNFVLNPQKLKENGFTPRQLGMPRPATWHKTQPKH